MTSSPILHFVMEKSEASFIGGNFWDGRATGERMGNPAAEQALGPFLNPLEQGLPDKACVVYRACTAGYPVSFEAVWGSGSCRISWPADTDATCRTENGVVALSQADRTKVNNDYAGHGSVRCCL